MKRMEDMTEPELRDLMVRCARAVKGELGDGSLFVLIVFDDPKLGQYISTCDRSTMIEALRETAGRLEARRDVER